MSNWTAYLQSAAERLGKTRRDGDTSRSVFQRDYDRIIFFDAFRRLQNKTQVLPVPKSEEVRNRLTHSLETASVGRSLGYLAGTFLLKKYPRLASHYGYRAEDFGYMVSAAALAHDIGNPPFGHEGEKAISAFFRSEKAAPFMENLTPREKADLQNFEGNAAGLRLLAHTPGAQGRIRGGLRLSFGTYGAFVKYPLESGPAMKGKFGIFQAEIPVFEEVAGKLNLIPASGNGHRAWKRFPLVYLTEAADDICYTLMDYEDGFHLGFIAEKDILERFGELARLDKAQKEVYDDLIPVKQRIAYLRAHAIGRLIREAVRIFNDAEEEIAEGHFEGALKDRFPENIRAVTEAVLRESIEKIYHHPAVLKNEAGGKTVIPFLLEKFVRARFHPKQHKQYAMLMPEDYRHGRTEYEKLLDAAMFVASMSDRQAVEWFRHFNGIQLADY